MVKKALFKKPKDLYGMFPTRRYLTYSPSLKEIPDLKHTNLNKYGLPLVYDLENTDERIFSKRSALDSAKEYAKYRAKQNRVVDLFDVPVDRSGVSKYKFYSVQFPDATVIRKTIKNRKKADSQKRNKYLSDVDIAAINQDMYFREVKKMARHKRVTKGKKSYRS